LIPIALPHLTSHEDLSVYAIYTALSLVNWKYLLTGLVLFRIFDIWKPFPIKRLENLPGGWGIMADDWLAGVYAAILLRVALHFGLVCNSGSAHPRKETEVRALSELRLRLPFLAEKSR